MPTIKAAVLGHPIAHSLSPILHNAAYHALGLTDWEYSSIDVEPDGLPEPLNSSLLISDEYVGFSLTMPLKTHVVPWLHDVESQGLATVNIDPLVAITGAANTLAKTSSQELNWVLSAFNTDVYGIVASIREVIRHGPVESIAILGAGATAASALAAAKELGVEQITVFARPTSSRALVTDVAEKLGLSNIVQWGNLNEVGPELGDYDAVISTLPAHAADPIAATLTQPEVEPAQRRSKPLASIFGTLLDVVYDPYPSELIATWSGLGGATITGERMLLHQAVKQVELMTGQPAPLAPMESALNAALTKKISC